MEIEKEKETETEVAKETAKGKGKPKKYYLFNQRFQKVELLGSGSYGYVYKVELKDKPGEYYALKKFRENNNNNEGFNSSAIREITILKELKHENIEKIIDTFYCINSLYVQYEYIECVLSKLIRLNIDKGKKLLSEADIKGIMQQILTGLAEIHRNGILHRDLAPSNILINKNGVVKIGDFGLARFIASPDKPMTSGIITRYYRPPEILFQAKFYSYNIDVWSAGCILAEMLLNEVLFKGADDIDMMKKIFTLLGIPNDSIWPNAIQLDKYIPFTGGPAETIQKKFSKFSEDCRDLLEKMLVLNPNDRISAAEALNHRYFTNEPLPSSKEKIAEIIKKYYLYKAGE